jgi:CRISPR type III-A-associated protein Csm2
MPAPASSMQDVQNYIKALTSLSALKPEDYAEKGGWADVVVQNSQGLKATQLRKIFHYIKDLKREFQKNEGNFNRGKVALIMPSLAYAQGRGHIPKDFYELLALCFGQAKCKTAEDFESAVNFLEAIMAYHKFYNPKES